MDKAPQFDHFKRSPSPHLTSHIEGTDAETPAPFSNQANVQKAVAVKCVQTHSPATNCGNDQSTPLSDSSHQEQVKDDSTHISNTSDHSEAKWLKSQTDILPQKSPDYEFSVQTKNSSSDQIITQSDPDSYHLECSTNDQTVVVPGQTASTIISSVLTNEPLQVMVRCNDKLITALSLDPQGIAGVLLAKGLIPENTEAQMHQHSTPREKATILVTAVRQRIEVSPKRFHDFLDILTKEEWTKDILEILRSSSGIRCRRSLSLRSTNEHSPFKNKSVKAMSGCEYLPSSEDYTFPTLNADDVVELEAQLIASAESMKKKFAALLWRTIESFKCQGISPRSLINGVFALTEYEDLSIGKPLLEWEKEALAKAQSIDVIFDILRPHMTFFNYEILEFLIETIGSTEDKQILQEYLHDFRCFCRRSVFEVPKSVFGHSSEKAIGQQYFHVKITKAFKSALLSDHTAESESSSEKICAPELGISLENAKHIQRKLALLLKLKISSLYLDTISTGSTILTFLIPIHIPLDSLDSDPEVIALSSNGIHILCGPPGKLEIKELTSNGLVVQWSQPEYGCHSLAKYILYYQKKCSDTKPLSEWQKLELTSLETHTCVSDLINENTYLFKISTVSDVGTLHYSNESDPVAISADRILTNNVYKVIVANKDILTSAISSASSDTIAVLLSITGIFSKEDATQISLASTPSESAALLVTAAEQQIKRAPEKFRAFLNALSEPKLSLSGGVVEALWSDYYNNVYKQYPEYLKFLYASLDKKQMPSDQWPPSATKKFFRLAMIKTATTRRGKIKDDFVRMKITGKVDDILKHKHPIELENIFKETKCQRKVILLEGAPGCGKSTLSVYICQQWEKGQLFNQFQLIILIQLRDPAVKNANGLADLLPCPDTATAQEITDRMLANKCQDVLFILDGWDELPLSLRKYLSSSQDIHSTLGRWDKNSIFCDMVKPNLSQSNPLCKSTVIVTSLPTTSADLHQLVSSRVEILGFTAKELYLFFAECLKGDIEAVKTLLEKIKENSEVAGSCYLPLNATVLVHLFKSDCNALPTTLYGTFLSLILTCIKRHLKLRTQYKNVSIESLDQIPEFTKKPFSYLCRLGYDGVMEDKIIFTSLPPDVNTLGLLQGVESFIGREKAVSHNFIHLSIQELLAAWYIATQLPVSEHTSKFNDLFTKSYFSTVFRFYAAITKLKAPGINDLVIRIAKKNERSLLIALLHGLYEAQDPSLCESVARQLQHGLDLSVITLTPSDCLCIGYFLAHACKLSAGEFKVYLTGCSIGDQGCKYLISGLRKYLDTNSAVTTLLHVDISRNAISFLGFDHLSTFLSLSCTSYLHAGRNNLLEQVTTHTPFGTFVEQLTFNTTLKNLWLVECGLNSHSIESLAEVLTTNKHLEELYIGDNALCDNGIQHLAYALRLNQNLQILDLVSCGMTDVGLECLAKSLQHNSVLNRVLLWNNAHRQNRITEKIVPVLTECLQHNHTLTKLELPKNFNSSTTSIEKAVNDVRKRSRLPLVKVSGMQYVTTCFHNNILLY